MIMEKIRRLIGHKEIPRDARELLTDARSPRELLRGLDELITRNEMEVNAINREIEALEQVESREVTRVREGALAERSKNNVLRRIQRLRKQMDNLEERQRIYNRNINLQIHLVGRVQALEAMEMRGVDETAIDSILHTYEEELCSYQNALDTEDLLVSELGPTLDDSNQLSSIEAEILGSPEEGPDAPESATPTESEPTTDPVERSENADILSTPFDEVPAEPVAVDPAGDATDEEVA